MSQAQAPTKYFIRFTDKNSSPYSISNPSAFLSAKAINRRLAHGISVNETDIPVNQWYLDSLTNIGVTLLNISRWFNGVSIYTTDSTKLIRINALPFVVSSTPVFRINPNGNSAGNIKNLVENSRAPLNPETSGYNYGVSYNQIHQINGDCLHNSGFHGEGMTIAILDAGFNGADTMLVFDSLRTNNQILGTKDFVQPGGNVYTQYIHGMDVLSTIGGNLPGQLVGTAPKAKFYLLRSEDAATENIIEEYNWVSAAEYADSAGADIISTSLGYTTFDKAYQNHTYSETNGHTAPITIAAEMASDKGILVVCSAGNSATQPWHYIGFPADADSVLTVGAVEPNGIYASFSSTGPTVDHRVKPDVAAQGDPAVVANQAGGITYESGTSFSCPITAGAVACLWQAHPTLSNMQLIQSIRESANQYTHPDSLLGYGIPDFCAASTILTGMDELGISAGNMLSASIYPNPFQGNFYCSVRCSVNTVAIIQLRDVLGRLIFSTEKTIYSNSDNILYFDKESEIRSGIYFLNISTSLQNRTLKLVKE